MISRGSSIFYSGCICIFSILGLRYLLQLIAEAFYIVACLELHFLERNYKLSNLILFRGSNAPNIEGKKKINQLLRILMSKNGNKDG